ADKHSDVTLKLVATYLEIGPAAGVDVDVQFGGTAKGELRTGTYQTDDQGFLDIPFHTPDDENVTVVIRAKSGPAPTINFSVVVAKDTVTIDWAGKKPRTIKKEADAELAVLAKNQRGAPVSGVEVTVELIGQNDFGAGFVGFTTSWTDGSGLARFQ